MSKIGFEFPLDGADQWDGFNDPGMEHFSGSPFQHLGREVPQNTIDAKTGNPARIEIRLRKVLTASIPDVNGLKAVMNKCSEATEKEGDEKPSKFFAEACSILEKKEINILQFADANTTGVKGPCENGKPFFAMMKATGQSKKAETSTGSYGIGKFAPYTVSRLRTVFLTTVWKDDANKLHHYVQGKAVLMSHIDANSKTRRGTGFWGIKEQCAPVTSLTDEIPEWLRRGKADELETALGTTLSIVGFSATKNWEDILAANIAENFFGTIHRGELEVEIVGSHLIDKDTLPSLLSNDSLKKAIKHQESEPEKFETIGSYLKALSGGEEVFVAKTENQHLGECELRILVAEHLPKKVAFLRNGMLITEGLSGLKRFSDFKEFVAVLECTSTKGQALLRAMEPPRHDAFEPDRLPPDKRSSGRTALRELSSWVREKLKQFAQDPVGEETSLDEMADFFADEAEDGVTKVKDENPNGRITVRARPVKPAKIAAVTAADDTGAMSVDGSAGAGFGIDGSPEGGNDGGENSAPAESARGGGNGGGGSVNEKPDVAEQSNRSPAGSGSGSGGAGGAKKPSGTPLHLINVRAVPLADHRRRRVSFTPAQSGTIVVHLQDSGADSNYPLIVISSSSGKVSDGKIEKLKVTANKRCTLEVELDQPFSGTLRIVADAV
ncbi:hypothetical protein [Methylobacterium sp. WL116]|uniref:hypothetical protein n=1 Tax=Methylobacterium sp. WL116 TaxID=2603889 RepID=UPI0011C7047C|nr:hypothetical protein [Methylobacterium sp. WL116]TXM94951.1 hypothetical protein FV223_02760 [Methylobacterium sp. WL116]